MPIFEKKMYSKKLEVWKFGMAFKNKGVISLW